MVSIQCQCPAHIVTNTTTKRAVEASVTCAAVIDSKLLHEGHKNERARWHKTRMVMYELKRVCTKMFRVCTKQNMAFLLATFSDA